MPLLFNKMCIRDRYLGVQIKQNGRDTDEIKERVGMERRAMKRLNSISVSYTHLFLALTGTSCYFVFKINILHSLSFRFTAQLVMTFTSHAIVVDFSIFL